MDPGSGAGREPTPDFAWTLAAERPRVRVFLDGELDIATAEPLRDVLRELLTDGYREMVLDLSRLDFVDSTGLHLFCELDAEARRGGAVLRLVDPTASVRRVFTVAGLDGALLPES